MTPILQLLVFIGAIVGLVAFGFIAIRRNTPLSRNWKPGNAPYIFLKPMTTMNPIKAQPCLV